MESTPTECNAIGLTYYFAINFAFSPCSSQFSKFEQGQPWAKFQILEKNRFLVTFWNFAKVEQELKAKSMEIFKVRTIVLH